MSFTNFKRYILERLLAPTANKPFSSVEATIDLSNKTIQLAQKTIAYKSHKEWACKHEATWKSFQWHQQLSADYNEFRWMPFSWSVIVHSYSFHIQFSHFI
jgi:hypothetical protein